MSLGIPALGVANTVGQMRTTLNSVLTSAANAASSVGAGANTNLNDLTVNHLIANVNITGANAVFSANVAFNSNASVLLPRGTTAQRSGPPGSFRYNGSTDSFEGRTQATGWGSIGGGGLTAYKITTGTYTANAADQIAADTSGGAFTVTLPASPSADDIVEFVDEENSWATTNLTIGRNGETIEGVAENLTSDVSGAHFYMQFNGTTWKVFGTSGADVSLGGVLGGTAAAATFTSPMNTPALTIIPVGSTLNMNGTITGNNVTLNGTTTLDTVTLNGALSTAVGNLNISGGTNGQAMITNGSGTISFAAAGVSLGLVIALS